MLWDLLVCAIVVWPVGPIRVSIEPFKWWCWWWEEAFEDFCAYACPRCDGTRALHTQIDQAVAGLALGPAQFAVDLAQVLPPVTEASLRGVLDSSRLYKS
jgi:hypothetical protein